MALAEQHEAGPAEPEEARPRWRLRMAVAAGLVALAVATAATVMGAMPVKLVSDPVGSPAPDFSLPLLGEGDLRLSSLRGSPVVLNFWASWCGPCKQEAPVLADGWRRWDERGVVFLGVDTRDSKRWAQEFVDRYGLDYPSVFDAGGGVMSRYGVRGLPETFFIDADGVIRAKWIGPIEADDLDRKIELILG